ncbi:MAG: FecR domain-containing protein [Planctomycetota bacterium]
MSCERYEELITLSVSGELSGEEGAELRGHLSACESCRLVMAREQKLWSMLARSREARGVPGAVTERLLQQVRAQVPAVRRRRPVAWRRWLVAAAAAAAFLLTLAALSGGDPEEHRGAPVRVARVVSGRLEARGDDEKWHQVSEVFSGQLCRVSPQPGSEARLEMDDGSHVRLERGMAFLLGRGVSRQVGGERTVELLSGALTADVAKDDVERFVVDAPGGRVTATGTRFWVRAGPPEGKEEIVNKKSIISGAMATALAVAVFEGSVVVDVKGAAAGEHVAIQAGEETKPVEAPEAAPQVGPRTVASAVPADALFFVSSAGRARWIKALKESGLGAAYREEQVEKFVSPLIEKLELLIKDRKAQVEQNLANTLKFEEIEKALQGEVGVAVIGVRPAKNAPENDPTKEEPILLFVAEVGEHAEAFETGMGEFIRRVQLLVEQEAGGAGTNHTARTYRGADLRVFTVDKHTIAYARTKGYFLLGFEAATVEKGIDCLEGKAPSLATAADIREVKGGLMRISADVAAWLKIEKAKDPEHKKWKEMAAAGIDGFSRVDYGVRFDAPMFVEELGGKLAKVGGLMKLATFAEPVDAKKLAADAPADALLFSALRLPAAKMVPTIMEVLPEKEADGFRKGLNELRANGLDLEALLKESLTGEVALYLTPGAQPLRPDAVLIARLKSSETVLESFKVFAQMIIHEQAVKAATSTTPDGKPYVDADKVRRKVEELAPLTADYAGGKLMYIPVKNPKPEAVVPAMLVLKDRMIVGTSDVAVKAAARRIGAEGSLAVRPEFADALAKLPAGPFGVQYVQMPRVFEAVYGIGAVMLLNRPNLKDKWGIDAKALPPAALISKHLRPEVWALYADGKGMAVRSVGNLPKGPLMIGAAIRADAKKGDRAGNAGPQPPDDGEPEPGFEEF